MTRPARFPSPHSCWESPTLSHSLTHTAVNSGPPSPVIPHFKLPYSTASPLCTHPPIHTCIPSWRVQGCVCVCVNGVAGDGGGEGGATLPAPSLEKSESRTPPRHFEGGYRPVHILSSSSSSFPASLPLGLHQPSWF